MAGEALRVLLIQSWVIPGLEIRTALKAIGFTPVVYRVDFEPALAAALPRSTYDVIILDPKSSGLSLPLLRALMREHNVRTPIVLLLASRDLGEDVLAALAAARN